MPHATLFDRVREFAHIIKCRPVHGSITRQKDNSGIGRVERVDIFNDCIRAQSEERPLLVWRAPARRVR